MYKNNKASVKKFLINDKGQKGQLQSFINGIKNGKNVADFSSLLYTSEASFKIIESLKDNQMKLVNIDKYLINL